MLPAGELSLPEEDNIIGFAGYLYDVEAQVYHVRNRYYDADLGRWLNRDPAGYVDGSNLYLYVIANPLVMFDPLGLNWYTDQVSYGWEGLKTVFRGNGDLHRARANSARVQAYQAEVIAKEESKGCDMSGAWSALDEAVTFTNVVLGNELIDLEQSRLDAIAAGAMFIPGIGPALAAGIEAGSAGADVAQGQYGEAALRGAGAGAAGLLPKAVKMLRSIGRSTKGTQGAKTQDFLQQLASRAERKIGGSGGAAGARKHKYVRDLHDRFARRFGKVGEGLHFEQSFRGGDVASYGAKGSIRLDVYEGPLANPTGIWDFKFGNAQLSNTRITNMRNELPWEWGDVPIGVVKP